VDKNGNGNVAQETGSLAGGATQLEADNSEEIVTEPEHEPRGIVARLTDISASRRGRWVVLLVWLVIAGLLTVAAPRLAGLYDNAASSSIGDQESVRAAELLNREFPNQRGVPVVLIFHNPSGLSEQDFAAAELTSSWLASEAAPENVAQVVSIYTVPQARPQLVAEDGKTMSLIAVLEGSTGEVDLQEAVGEIRDYTDRIDEVSSPLQVKVTGPAGVIADAVLIFESADITLLLTTVVLVLVLLIVIYRSPILALVPLFAVGWALMVVNGILAFAAQWGLFPISQQAASIMTVLLFGAGTDYVIFASSRYREELLRERDHVLALKRAMRGVAEAIASSAGTVIVALLMLLLATLGLYNSLGWVLAIAVFVMLAAGLTMVPAMLSVLGRLAFWPFIPRARRNASNDVEAVAPARGFWGRVAVWVTRHPVTAILSSIIFLGVLTLGNLGTSQVYNFLTGFRKATPSLEGYNLLASSFEEGTLAPFNLVVDLKGGDAYTQFVALDRIAEAVAGVPNVVRVSGPTRPDGNTPGIEPAALQEGISQIPAFIKEGIRSGQGRPPGTATSSENQPSGPDGRIIGLYAAGSQYISQSNSTVRLQVILGSDPYGVPAIDTIAKVREAARGALKESGLTAEVGLTGVTPQLADTRSVSDLDVLIVVPLVLVLTAIILGVLLKSLIAPLYLLAAVTLNYFAALGASAFLFTRIEGDEGLAYAVPLYSFIFLVALGVDYTIFLMTRVREEAASRGTVAGTRVALSRTGQVITSAGLILAGTFLVLTTLPLRDLYQFGVIVGLGVLLDTFVVRGFLVPGIVVLLDRWNWWPGGLPGRASR
jgi:uncharacterized membrane protein YdfJ with MMPL/SSD domain